MSILLSKLEPERQLALVNSALKEFSVKGYDGASTNVIAKEANISKALMFHYITNKEVFFLYLYDYCLNLIQSDYLQLMDNGERDIFKRLEQSYLLQIELLQRHPWLFDFNQLSAPTKSTVINQKLAERANEKEPFCFERLFADIDESLFREELTIQRCKELIFWGNVGFTNDILGDIRKTPSRNVDYEAIINKLTGYFSELRLIFYREE